MIEPYFDDGTCTIYHGDCAEVLCGLIEQGAHEPIDLLATDPPYGIDYQSNFRKATPTFDRIDGDKAIDGAWLGVCVYLLRPDSAAYVCSRWDVVDEWQLMIEAHGLRVRNRVVWWKRGGGMGDLDGTFSPDHEIVLFAVNGKHKLRGKRIGDVWMLDKEPPSRYVHPTQKPVSLMERIIGCSTDPGGLVLDPFMGSGTTLRAAMNLGRRAIGIEIDERYCEAAAARLQQQAFDLGGV